MAKIISKTEKTFNAIAKGATTAAAVMEATKIDAANTQGFLRSLQRQGRIVKQKANGKVSWKIAKAKPAAKASKAPKMELSPMTAADHAAAKASSAAARASIPARHKKASKTV